MRPQRRSSGFTLIELMIAVAIIGILAAIAIPNFVRLQARAKQSEAKAHLKALFQAEKAFFQAKDRYSPRVLDVGFFPERNNRYQYFLGALSGPFDVRTGTQDIVGTDATGISIELTKYPAISPQPFSCGSITGVSGSTFVGGAQAQIDDDPALDMWTVSTETRLLTGCDAAGNSPGGEPANENNDLNH